VGDAYEKIAQVTKAFNSAFLTYKEEAYLTKRSSIFSRPTWKATSRRSTKIALLLLPELAMLL